MLVGIFEILFLDTHTVWSFWYHSVTFILRKENTFTYLKGDHIHIWHWIAGHVGLGEKAQENHSQGGPD